MPDSQAVSGFGTTLARAGSVIAELDTIGGVNVTAKDINVTTHASPGGYEEYIQGLRDGGDVAIEGNLIASDSNGQVGLLTDFNAGTIQDFVMSFPDGTTWTFKAYVKAFSAEGPKEDKVKFKASLKVTGKPSLGITSAPNLTALVVTTGTLVPAFAAGTYEYVVNILTGVASVTVTPTCAAANSILVYGNVVASGQASSAIVLGAARSIKNITVVTREANKADKVYTLHLTRA